MNDLDLKYQNLLEKILAEGVEKSDRTGTGTISIFGAEIRHKMSDGYPLLTTKKMAFKTMVTELLWFLRGDTNIKYLVDNGCNIWNGDAYKAYINTKPDTLANNEMSKTKSGTYKFLSQEEFIERIKNDDGFAEKWGELGPIYGKQWRNWNNIGSNGDQISNLLHELKDNPDSRRLMVNAWSIEDLPDMTLPPCHYGFQVYTVEMSEDERRLRWCEMLGKDISYANRIYNKELDEFNFPKRKISLMFNQRSADYFLGVPFNIASYGLLLTILGKITGMLPDQLIGRFGDTHLYSNHIEAARKQLQREPFDLPGIGINKDESYWRQDLNAIVNGLTKEDFHLVDYQSHERIKAKLSN